MLDPDLHHRLSQAAATGDPTSAVKPDDLTRLGEWLLNAGVAVAGIKCGTKGFYLATGSKESFRRAGRGAPAGAAWAGRRLFSDVFTVDLVASGTGAGDASIAGFLAAMLRGTGPEEALNMACATGAAVTTEYDATSGVQDYDTIRENFVERGTKARQTGHLSGWVYEESSRLWRGSGDCG